VTLGGGAARFPRTATRTARKILSGSAVANPACSVRGPSHIVKSGKTPVLDPTEAPVLLDSIDVTTPAGLRNRALPGRSARTWLSTSQRSLAHYAIIR
jgi:hypothetical protein